MGAEKKIDAVLFDLDGTLIFLEQSSFLSEYIKSISSFVANYGLDPKRFVDSVMYGTHFMLNNDGSLLNSDIFWEKFFESYGEREKSEEIIKISDEYYVTKFKELKDFTRYNANAKTAVELAHRNGRKVVLATNPVFPMTAQLERLSWAGLSQDDFDLVTSYENSSYCKPDPDYYFEICKKIGIDPHNALMVGNDEREDMKAATEAGLMGYLSTDCRIMAKDFYWTGQRGTFEQVLHVLEIIWSIWVTDLYKSKCVTIYFKASKNDAFFFFICFYNISATIHQQNSKNVLVKYDQWYGYFDKDIE